MSSSSSSRSDNDSSFDVEEFLQIESRCRELRKEKEMLRESQSQSFELIRGLELHVKSLSDAHNEDKKHIEKLERELLNCTQEIDYLQDQLNAKSAEVCCLQEHVHDLELKLADMENLHVKVGHLSEGLKRSDSERLLLIEELQSKQVELQESALLIERLEESISSLTLDSQCEIESMKFDIMSLEQACFEANKIQEETNQEKERMDALIRELQVRIHDAEGIVESLETENKELREKMVTSGMNGRIFLQKIEKWLENQDRLQLNSRLSSNEPENRSNISKEICGCEDDLGPLCSKLAIVFTPESNLEEQMDGMLLQINEYEVLVKQLKEALREEKLKAKEEAEDLTQEMAELRYKMTGLLEEECKRRAYIEQTSLQRIAELEARIQKEKRKSFADVRHLNEA